MEVGGGEGAVFEIVLCLQTRNGRELRCLGDPREILGSVIHCVNGVTCRFVLKEVIGGTGSADAACVCLEGAMLNPSVLSY